VAQRAIRVDVLGFRRAMLASHPLHVAVDTLSPLLQQLFAHFCVAAPPAQRLPPSGAAAATATATATAAAAKDDGDGGGGGVGTPPRRRPQTLSVTPPASALAAARVGAGASPEPRSAAAAARAARRASSNTTPTPTRGERKAAMALPMYTRMVRAAGLLRMRGEPLGSLRLSESQVRPPLPLPLPTTTTIPHHRPWNSPDTARPPSLPRDPHPSLPR